MAAPRWTTIDELRDLHGWATPDPWCVTQLDDWAVLAEPDGDTVCGGLTEPDARLVVLLRNAFPGLLRDADTLIRARQLAAHATDVTAKNSEVTKAMRALLDLLTEDPS